MTTVGYGGPCGMGMAVVGRVTALGGTRRGHPSGIPQNAYRGRIGAIVSIRTDEYSNSSSSLDFNDRSASNAKETRNPWTLISR